MNTEIRLDFSKLDQTPIVWQTIQKIAAEPSRNGKIAILEQNDTLLFRWVLQQVFDTTIVFGVKIKKAEWEPCLKNGGTRGFTQEEIHFLVMLANGRYTRREAVIQVETFSRYLDPDSLKLLVAIINKDIAAGINASTINKVFKGLIPTYPYMRCSLPTQVPFDELPWDAGVYAQEKADGMFNNINVADTGEVEILSRQGTAIPTEKLGESFQLLKDTLDPGYQYHGEMLIVEKEDGEIQPREIGNGIVNSICKGGELPAKYAVFWQLWDMIPIHSAVSKGKYTEPYAHRFEKLMKVLHGGNKAVLPITTQVVHSLNEAKSFYRFQLLQGHEGAVLKAATAIWKDGTSKEQIKMKMALDCDLVVKGFLEGEGKFEGNLGALMCESSDGWLKTNISGFNDAMRREIWDHKDDYLGKIVTVRFNDVMVKEGQPAALFLPRFIEFREDKSDADDLNRILATQKQAIGA